MEKLNFSLPNIWEYFPIYKNLLTSKSHFIKDTVSISSVYGVFPGASRLAGGRFILYDSNNWPSQQDIVNTITFYNTHSVSVRFAFNNLLATEDDLKDSGFNSTLEIGHNELNGVIVGNPVIEDYVRLNFPKYQIISSITNWNTSKQYALNELDRGVDMLVLNSSLVRDFDFVKSLDASRVEILVNDGCQRTCSVHRREHYCHESRMNLNFIDDKTASEQIVNYHMKASNLCDPMEPKEDELVYEIPPDPEPLEIEPLDPRLGDVANYSWELDSVTFNKLVDIGIVNFKFAGRDLLTPPLLAYYLVNNNDQHKELELSFFEINNELGNRL